jgi:hypothetical protein
MELYTAGTGNGQRAAIAVNECGVPCTMHVLNLAQGDQKKPLEEKADRPIGQDEEIDLLLRSLGTRQGLARAGSCRSVAKPRCANHASAARLANGLRWRSALSISVTRSRANASW